MTWLSPKPKNRAQCLDNIERYTRISTVRRPQVERMLRECTVAFPTRWERLMAKLHGLVWR